MIEPRLHSLPAPPADDDSDLETSTKRHSLKPAAKVGGARQKDKKGKKRTHSSDSDADTDEAPATKQHRGRPKGSSNFSGPDITQLLVCTERVLPVGGKGWKEVTASYNKWAVESNRPERDTRSLESKFKLVCRVLSIFLFTY
jgi:hypothetical protein